MEIKKTVQDDICTLVVSGRLDALSAPELEEKVDFVEEEKLILDFSSVPYISSAGLRVLLVAYKKMVKRKGLELISIQPEVKEILDMTGFTSLLGVE